MLHSGFYCSKDDAGCGVTTEAIRCAKLQSNLHHQYHHTNTLLFTGRMPFLSASDSLRPWRYINLLTYVLSPNQQSQNIEGRKYHTPRTCSPNGIVEFNIPLDTV